MSISILWVSDVIWGTRGYCGQGRLVLPRLARLGHKVYHFPFRGFSGGNLEYGPVRVLPALQEGIYGLDVLASYWEMFKFNLQVNFHDIWTLPLSYRSDVGAKRLAVYFPIDHEPLSALIRDRIPMVDYPIVYSRFACRQMEEANLPYYYIPHALDVDTFAPGDKAAARKALGLPQEAFICTMVAANAGGWPPRKAFPENLAAFKRFQERHADAFLYLHTNLFSFPGERGLDFGALLRELALLPGTYRFANQTNLVLGIPDRIMADVYRASDVLLAASMAEGFGLPICEAQLCGTPVITTNFSAMPENTVNGICTEPLPQRHWSFLDAWQAYPSVEAIHEALEAIYSWSGEERARRAEEGIRHFRDGFAADKVVEEYWVPFLQEVQMEMEVMGG